VQVDLSDLEGELLPLFPKGGFEKYKIISFYFNVFVCALVSIKNVWLAHQIRYFSYGSNFLQCVGLKESIKSKWDLNIAEVMRRDVIRMIRFEKLCPVGQTPDITFQ
jgi:hypothetical protein